MNDLKQLVADNITKLMSMSGDCKSQLSLSKRSGIGQSTISNYLRPEEYEGSPQIDKLQKIANCFGLETWQLLHPTMGDKEITAKEIQMYRRWRELFTELQDQPQ